ncbi:hypothetical protein FSARC_9305 [Fusarium sarcochroum]|uniref:Rhodopsin domain-containing protein n=1 Tax=Fusarium sarcochroum TaxID=1208366 RepID=A0A8H4TRA7_9HYPO|nr:hypothetical protein FSARC_9305 [Fusarium sarcochroum]
MDPRTSFEESAAAMADLRAFNVEAFSLLGIAVLVTALRSYVRISAVGFRNLWADDYLVVLAAGIYAIETGLAYSVGNIAKGLANNSMTDEQRASLHPDDREYQLRVMGSKIQLVLWATYSSLLWVLKAAICTFYYRLTKDLDGYRTRVTIGFALIIISFVTIQLNLLLSCRPFVHWWQIYPDPGAFCHAAISPGLIWTCLAFNIITDFYLIMIPMPMLWKAAMPWPQKVGLISLFSCGLFVTMAAILRVVLVVSNTINGPQLAASWAVRETFVAIMTTNIPMLFPTFKQWVVPIVDRASSSLSPWGTPQSTISDSRFSGAISIDTWRRKNRRSSRLASNGPMSHHANESEVRIVEGAGLSYIMLDSSTTKPDISKPTRSATLSVHHHIDTSAQADTDHGNARLSTRSRTSTISWSESPIHSPSTEGTEFLLDRVYQDGYSRNV